MSSAICFNLDQSKILSSGNGLKSTSVKQGSIYSSGNGTKCSECQQNLRLMLQKICPLH